MTRSDVREALHGRQCSSCFTRTDEETEGLGRGPPASGDRGKVPFRFEATSLLPRPQSPSTACSQGAGPGTGQGHRSRPGRGHRSVRRPAASLPASRVPGEDKSEAEHPRPGSCLTVSSPPSGARWPPPFQMKPLQGQCSAPCPPCAPGGSGRARPCEQGCHSGRDIRGKLSGNGTGSPERDQMAGLTPPDPQCRSCSRGARLAAGQVSPLPGWVTEARARPH